MKLDIACGGSKKGEDWIGVDIANVQGVDIVHDLNQYPWPFEDNSIDEIHCSHYIEHIPHDVKNEDNRDGLIQFMDECYRILKPKGKMKIIAPYYSSMRAYGDPTHVRFISDMTFWYYNKEWRDSNKLSHYNINCDFDIKYSYYITNELTLKAKEVRDEMFKRNLNVIDDIMAELIKR